MIFIYIVSIRHSAKIYFNIYFFNRLAKQFYRLIQYDFQYFPSHIPSHGNDNSQTPLPAYNQAGKAASILLISIKVIFVVPPPIFKKKA